MPGHTAYPYVLVIELPPGQEDAELILDVEQKHRFSLTELFEQAGLEYTTDQLSVSVGLLGTQEIGTLDPSLLGVPTDTQTFTFAVMADPQGGDPQDTSNGSLTRIKIHNAFVEDSVALVSLIDNPAFCLVLGDIVDDQGQPTNFEEMLSYFRRAEVPWLFSIGNHETAYRLTFGPGYDWSDFANYFTAQRAINGSSKLLYSFDIGRWHFIVWPDPLRDGFWESHPHYFDWLEQDLEKHKDQPTFFLQHVPVHPIGIDPLVSYVESVTVKRTLLDILAKYGNVKYVLSGHVHIPLRASLKTAVSYRGMNLINLPAAGFRPRAFGEEDLTGGPVQGVAVVQIEGEKARLTFRTVTDQEYVFPESFPELDTEAYPLWLQHKWELPAPERIVNGDFAQDLRGWHRRFVYQEDDSPTHRSEVRTFHGRPALYLSAACRGYRVPGQDRVPQTINRVCQAITLAPGQRPTLSFHYQVDADASRPETWAGAFVWLEGFARDEKKLDRVYSIGKAYGNLRDQHRSPSLPPTEYLELASSADTPHHVVLNVAQDYEQSSATAYADLNLDRLVVNLGAWTANERPDQRWGVYVWNITQVEAAAASSVNGRALQATPPAAIWRKAIDHIAGEHIHVAERYVPPERS